VTDLAQSYAACQRYARESRSNFYYCFYLLPRAKRLAMCALYAYLRRVDDVGDGPSASGEAADTNSAEGRLEQLRSLRGSLNRALSGKADDAVFTALADTVARFRIPSEYLYAAIEGVRMDLTGRTYETWPDLQEYCRCVASVVGQACIHIWGFTSPAAIALAGDCGLAFQLTNILRDLGEDAARGRVYLPADDFRRFRYTAEDLRRGVLDARFFGLLRFEAQRAEAYYNSAAGLVEHLHPDGRRVYYAMFHTYHRLLQKIHRFDGPYFARRVRLAGWEKLRTAAEALFMPAGWRSLPVNPGTPAA
jgi:phytoene synthase